MKKWSETLLYLIAKMLDFANLHALAMRLLMTVPRESKGRSIRDEDVGATDMRRSDTRPVHDNSNKRCTKRTVVRPWVFGR